MESMDSQEKKFTFPLSCNKGKFGGPQGQRPHRVKKKKKKMSITAGGIQVRAGRNSKCVRWAQASSSTQTRVGMGGRIARVRVHPGRSSRTRKPKLEGWGTEEMGIS